MKSQMNVLGSHTCNLWFNECQFPSWHVVCMPTLLIRRETQMSIYAVRHGYRYCIQTLIMTMVILFIIFICSLTDLITFPRNVRHWILSNINLSDIVAMATWWPTIIDWLVKRWQRPYICGNVPISLRHSSYWSNTTTTTTTVTVIYATSSTTLYIQYTHSL